MKKAVCPTCGRLVGLKKGVFVKHRTKVGRRNLVKDTRASYCAEGMRDAEEKKKDVKKK